MNTEVAVAGRIMLKRQFGKLAFLQLQDDHGTVQLYFDKKKLKDSFQQVKQWIDSGDIVGTYFCI